MTKSYWIDQATKAWFVLATVNFAGYTEMGRLAAQDYDEACHKLSHNFGVSSNDLAEIIKQARVQSFYTDFARQILGGSAVEVTA